MGPASECGAVWLGPHPPSGVRTATATSRRAPIDQRPSYSVSSGQKKKVIPSPGTVPPNLTCQLSNMGNLDLHLHGFSRVLQVNKKGVWLRCHERSVALAAHAVRKQQHDVRRTEYCAVLYHNPSFFFSSQLLNSDVMS